MYKVVILILSLVCGVRAGKAVEALPETTVASSFQLYQAVSYTHLTLPTNSLV